MRDWGEDNPCTPDNFSPFKQTLTDTALLHT